MPTKKPRLTFALSKEELEQVESFRKKHNIKNQSQAILTLINKGIEDIQKDESFVPIKKAPSVSDEAMRIATAFEQADEDHKEIVRAALAKYLAVPTAKESNARLA